jgi:lysophospholipase L1-like esterase
MTTTIRFRALALCLALATPAAAAPLRVLAIGDSMTEEYAFELPFSAPESNPTNASARNWPELFRIFRGDELSLGNYKSLPGSYLDLRTAGHEWNFSIPGATIVNWKNLLYNTPSEEDDADLAVGYGITKNALLDKLGFAEAVVIILGANDLKKAYNDLFNDTENAGIPPDKPKYFENLLVKLNDIHAWVRFYRPNVPLVVCTLPDVGATPQISGIYHVPAKQATTRAKIAAFNQTIISWAAGKSPRPAVARLDLLTDRIFDQVPFQINGTVFTLAGSEENPPLQVFCRDGFHVSTVGQALIANEIMASLETVTGRDFTLFTNREILRFLLGQNPDQPYLDWIAAAGISGSGSGMDQDPDGDGFPNLAEFLLASPPGAFGSPLTGSFSPGASLTFHPSASSLRFASLTAEESTDLSFWTEVPGGRTAVAPDGTVSITPAAGQRGFVRLRAEAKP